MRSFRAEAAEIVLGRELPVFLCGSPRRSSKVEKVSEELQKHGGVDGTWTRGATCAGVGVKAVKLDEEVLEAFEKALSSKRKKKFEPVSALILRGPFDTMEDVALAILGASGGALFSEEGNLLELASPPKEKRVTSSKPKVSPHAKTASAKTKIDVSIPREVEARFATLQARYRLARRKPIDVKFGAVAKALGPISEDAGFSMLGGWDSNGIGNLVMRTQERWEPWAAEVALLGLVEPDGYLFLQFERSYQTSAKPEHWRAMLQVFCAAARLSEGALWRISDSGELVAYDFTWAGESERDRD